MVTFCFKSLLQVNINGHIYVHNRLCSAEVVGDGDIQISRIHKIHILLYQEAEDEKAHIYWRIYYILEPDCDIFARVKVDTVKFEL